MKKTLAILGGCLLVFSLMTVSTVQAGAGCCPSKSAKADKASCGPGATQTSDAGAKTCVIDGKTVAYTVNADGTCSMPAGTVTNASGTATTKSCIVDGKTITCTVNADGSCTMAAGSCSSMKAAGSACHAPTATTKADSKTSKKASKAESKKAGI